MCDSLEGEFLALLGAVEKIEVDELLVRQAGFVGEGFEIVQDLRAQVDAHSLFLAGVGVLPLFQLAKIVFLLPSARFTRLVGAS